MLASLFIEPYYLMANGDQSQLLNVDGIHTKKLVNCFYFGMVINLSTKCLFVFADHDSCPLYKKL